MNDKFQGVPIDPDTRIRGRRVVTVGGFEALHERWSFDGVAGESLVFISADVANLSDEELRALALESSMVIAGSELTIKRGESGFTFVSFNFSA